MKQSEISKALDNLQNEYSFEAQIISILNGSNLKYRGHIGLAKFTKDIAIGFVNWFFESNYIRHKLGEDIYCTYGSGNYKYTEEQLFNEYLNTLK